MYYQIKKMIFFVAATLQFIIFINGSRHTNFHFYGSVVQ